MLRHQQNTSLPTGSNFSDPPRTLSITHATRVPCALTTAFAVLKTLADASSALDEQLLTQISDSIFSAKICSTQCMSASVQKTGLSLTRFNLESRHEELQMYARRFSGYLHDVQCLMLSSEPCDSEFLAECLSCTLRSRTYFVDRHSSYDDQQVLQKLLRHRPQRHSAWWFSQVSFQHT